MKIGLDLDGTITDAPEFFSLITSMIISQHEVHIITYREDAKENVAAELDGYGVKYTEIHLPPWNSESAPAWKREIAETLDLDIMFEDSPEVLDQMPEKVKRFWFCNPEIINLKAAINGITADLRMGTI
jgi:hypothetical protein